MSAHEYIGDPALIDFRYEDILSGVSVTDYIISATCSTQIENL